MTPTRFMECLGLLRWSKRTLAEAASLDERQVRRWTAGQADVPPAIAAWLERAARFHAANPVPPRESRHPS